MMFSGWRVVFIFIPVFLLVLLSGCDSNSLNVTDPVTSTPGPTVTPAPTSNPTTPSTTTPKPTVSIPTPTPRPVTAKPQDLVLRLNQFPLPGFKVTDDLSRDEGQVWRRRFTAVDAGSIGYNWLMIDVRSLSRPTAESWIKAQDCVWSGSGGTPAGSFELTAPEQGDGAKACRFTWDTGSRLYTYATGSRNIGLFVQTNTSDAAATDSEILELLVSLADRQLAVIDQLESPGQNTAPTTGASAFQFNPPQTLPSAAAGKPYSFSFCQPVPTNSTSGCGPALGTTSPSGGNPPYLFQVHKGFPPFGIRCGNNGTCEGTPPILAVDRKSVFTVCAIDSKGDFACREVSLSVDVPAEVINSILGKAVRADPVMYDLVTTPAGQPAITEKMWVKGSKFRAETKVGEQPAVLIIDSSTQTMHVYAKEQNRTLKTAVRPEDGVEGFTPAGMAKSLRESKLTVVGTEVIDGKVCLVLEGTEEKDYNFKVWLWKEYGFPVRLELPEPKGKVILEWKNIKLGNVSDNMFVLPAEVEVTVVPFEAVPAAFARLNPKPVTAEPQKLAIPLDQFPLPGFKITDDKPLASGKIWTREFTPVDSSNAEYPWVNLYIYPLDSPRPTSWIKTQDCVWGSTGSTAPLSSVELTTAPGPGDGVKACRFTFAAGSQIYRYYTGSRNVGLSLSVAANKAVSDTEVLELMTSIAERQLVTIDRIDPPFPPAAQTTTTTPFEFNPPAVLPGAVAGKPYQFSFCQPTPQSRTSPCGPMPATSDPKGGSPPYHFQYGTMGGFPPFGLTLGKDGHLDGTPHKTSAGKTYRFTVCAVDLKGDPVCREVTLTVSTTPTPTPTLTPVPPTPGGSLSGIAFQFNPPAVLPEATAGKSYLFSFCQPMPQTRTSPCGPMPPTSDPKGGSPPYHFQYGTMGGFPPFGLTLGKDGHLDGTPEKATAGKTYRFTVCAVDLKADQVCREVSLTVSAAPTPASTLTGPWTGKALLTTTVTGGTCEYAGDITLVLKHIDTTLSGTINYNLAGNPANSRVRCPATTLKGSAPLSGTVKGGAAVRFSFITNGFNIEASGLSLFGAFIEGDFAGDATGKWQVEPGSGATGGGGSTGGGITGGSTGGGSTGGATGCQSKSGTLIIGGFYAQLKGVLQGDASTGNYSDWGRGAQNVTLPTGNYTMTWYNDAGELFRRDSFSLPPCGTKIFN